MRTRPLIVGVVALFASLLALPFTRAEEIRAVSEKLDERVDSIEIQQGRAVLKTPNRTIPLEQVKQIRFEDRGIVEAAGAKVVLTNKDEVRGTMGLGTNEGFQLKTAAVGAVNVNFNDVAAIFFDVPPDTERKLTTKLLDWLSQAGFKGRPDRDVVYLKSGGKTPEDTIVNEISTKGIAITSKSLGNITFPLKDLELVIFGNTGGKPAPMPAGTVVRIRCTDGSVISGAIKSLGNGKIELDGNPLGGTPPQPVTIQLKDAVELMVLNGAFVYLSDLDPTKVDEHFPEGYERDPVKWGWKRDREVLTGARLRLGGRTFDKGLGVHTYSSLTFSLGGAYKKFRASVGVDDGVKFYGPPNAGRVTFRVLVDGKPAKELAEGITKKKGEPPQELEVDVQGTKELTLIADYGGFMHVLGRGDWADAHLVK